jgi:peroxiredoxin
MIVSVAMLSLTLLLGGGPDLGRGTDPRPASTPAANDSHELAEPPAAEICVGDPAPDFAYQGYDGRWMRLHHLLDQGSVLLVFGGNEAQLSQLEREREALLSLGVIPVAVVDRRPGGARKLAVKLGLAYTVLADSRQVIAAQFNATEAGRVTPSWFVIDGHGKVRGLLRGAQPVQDYLRVSARSLALPMPGTPLPVSR